MTAPDQHAPFAPSGLHRVVACPGSYNMIRNARAEGKTLSEEDTDDSREGTAAHEVAAHIITPNNSRYVVGSLTSNGVAVTEEMIEGAELYAETVAPYLNGARIEEPIKCQAIDHECYGTPDFTYGPDNGVLVVVDYKFGHRYVDAFENWQLIAYAIGTMPSYLPTCKVMLGIVQPRSYHRDGPVRWWVIDGDTMRDYASTLRIKCAEAVDPDARCVTGPQCYKCPARTVCEAAIHMEQAALYLSGSTIPLDASVEAKAVRLHQVRRALDHLKEMESGLSEDLTAAVRRGQTVPGFTLKAGSGREKWTHEITEVVALGAAMGVDLSKPGCITPNQARKAGLSPDIVAAYSERTSGEVELVEDDGKAVRRIFAATPRIYEGKV